MAEKFSHATIQELRGHTLKRYLALPTRIRLAGMNRDLNDTERQAMAFFEGAVEVLNRLGVLDRDKLDEIMPAPFTAGHEVLDEGVIGHSFTPQK